MVRVLSDEAEELLAVTRDLVNRAHTLALKIDAKVTELQRHAERRTEKRTEMKSEPYRGVDRRA